MQSISRSSSIMEEEWVKRKTDCVYFLASPLTCKKGLNCEYRHSENARLNPRDCHYWLAGNCFHPSCAFRHPPLDVHNQVSSESEALPYQAGPANKINVPCHFFFNGFCFKGDRCQFLHGPLDSAITGKSFKPSSPPSDHKICLQNDGASASTETDPSPSKAAIKSTKETGLPLKEDLQQTTPKTMPRKSVSPKTSLFELEEAPFVMLGSLSESQSPMCKDDSSEEQVGDHIEPEERWESSPGFDVLVDNKSEDLDHENDAEYLPRPDGEQMEQNLSYDYEDLVRPDHRYPSADFPYDQDVYEAYEDSDKDCIFDNATPSLQPRVRSTDSFFYQKRRFNDGIDLRDHLRKRRVVEGNHHNLIGQSSERPQSYRRNPKPKGRLASELGRNSTLSMEDQSCLSNPHSWLNCLEPNRPIRHPNRKKSLRRKKYVSSEVSKERKSKRESAAFTGPKTLAQIKEEKRKVEYNGGTMRHSSRTASTDFQGPKPLSEILIDKGRQDTEMARETS